MRLREALILCLFISLVSACLGYVIGATIWHKEEPRSWSGTILSVDQMQDDHIRFGGKDPVIVVKLDSPGLSSAGLFNRIKEVSVPRRTFSLLKVGDNVVLWKVDGKIEFEGVVPK